MDTSTILRVKQAFTETAHPVYKELKELSALTGSDHLSAMFGCPEAVDCKIERSRHVGRLIGSPKGNIIDFGCGCGFLACMLAAEDAAQVTGVETNGPRRAVAMFLAERVFQVGNVRFVDDLEDVPLNSVDGVVLANVISHLSRMPLVIAKIIACLKYRGRLFIEDNNNAGSPLVRWQLRHRVWPGERWAGEVVYLGQRETWIHEHYSGIRDETVRRLALATYGLEFGEMKRFVDAWLKEGEQVPFSSGPLRRYAPVDPACAQYHENAYSAHEVAHLLLDLGMAPTLIGAKYVFDYKRHPFVSWCFQHFPELALYVAPAYEVLAVRR